LFGDGGYHQTYVSASWRFLSYTILVQEQFQTDVPLSYTCTYSMYQGAYTYSDQESDVWMSLVDPKKTPDNICDVK